MRARLSGNDVSWLRAHHKCFSFGSSPSRDGSDVKWLSLTSNCSKFTIPNSDSGKSGPSLLSFAAKLSRLVKLPIESGKKVKWFP